MRTYLSVKNYRCFAGPVTVEIAAGFTAFVGINNAGKSMIISEKISINTPLRSDRKAFLDLCASKGVKSHVLDRRAIENYFPGTNIKRIFGTAYQALTPYRKLSEVSPNWSKNLNWKIAADMTFSDIQQTDLGIFLESL